MKECLDVFSKAHHVEELLFDYSEGELCIESGGFYSKAWGRGGHVLFQRFFFLFFLLFSQSCSVTLVSVGTTLEGPRLEEGSGMVKMEDPATPVYNSTVCGTISI